MFQTNETLTSSYIHQQMEIVVFVVVYHSTFWSNISICSVPQLVVSFWYK